MRVGRLCSFTRSDGATRNSSAFILFLVELKGLVQDAHRELGVLLLDHHGDLDLRGRDHLDVDALLGQRAEHLRGDAACERMPMPTIDTLAMRSSPVTSRHLMCGCTWLFRSFIAFA